MATPLPVKFMQFLLCGSLCAMFTASLAGANQDAYQPVTSQRLDNAQSDQGWLMFDRDYTGRNFAPYQQITAKNVQHLTIAWKSAKVDMPIGFEDTPIVVGDYMFVTTPKDRVIAYNAVTGTKLWEYDDGISSAAYMTACCGPVNRGVAVYDKLVIFGTLDNHVVALDARNGKPVWNVSLEEAGTGYSITEAPLIVNGKVIIGSGGGEFGARGFIVGLDAETGALIWKTYTIPAEDQPGGDTWPAGAYERGGGNPWMTGTFDPDTNTLFWGVGNPGPWLAQMRPGRNLYSDSLLALDPDTGALKWYYQYTANDAWDYDGVNTPVLTELSYDGKTYKAIVEANRNGYFYAIDRMTGKLIYARPFVHDTTIQGIENGQAVARDAARPVLDNSVTTWLDQAVFVQVKRPVFTWLRKSIFTCPSYLGGKNWWPMAVDPESGMAYVPTLHACMTMKAMPVRYLKGLPYLGEVFHMQPDPASPGMLGSLQAIDLSTGQRVWQRRTAAPWDAGALATGGGLVFSGTPDGHLLAFDAKTGKTLWTSPALGSGVIAAPISYEVDGKQYVAVWSGWGGIWSFSAGKLGAPLVDAPRGGRLYVFRIGS